MLNVAKKEKQTFQLLFSTEDLDFDPKRVEVKDVETGKILKVESSIERVGKKKKKIFGIRMEPEDIQKIRQTARRADMEIGEFAREALAKAVAEKAEDSKRIRKNKR